MTKSNFDPVTIASFGDEWSRHRQENLTSAELEKMFDDYFHIVPWSQLPPGAQAFDMGTGTGRWARLAAPRVGELHVIDAAEDALSVARQTLAANQNVIFHHATTDSTDLTPGSFDFGYSLGVLHHIPDTESALKDCVSLLKPGGMMLLYLYYRFDNRPWWFRAVWKASDLLRRGICRLPPTAKSLATDFLALVLYLPLSRLAWLAEKCGLNPRHTPLASYRHHSFATLRTDSRDRFGTPLEQRFTRSEIAVMMQRAGLADIVFSDRSPFWTAIGTRRDETA